ncbi:MAG TPA: GTPase ObgE, partial [Propionicimonas sp.]
QVEIGAEILSRRGEDNRMVSDRPAAQRRRVKDAEYHAAKAAEREAEREAAKATRLATEGFGSEDDD